MGNFFEMLAYIVIGSPKSRAVSQRFPITVSEGAGLSRKAPRCSATVFVRSMNAGDAAPLTHLSAGGGGGGFGGFSN